MSTFVTMRKILCLCLSLLTISGIGQQFKNIDLLGHWDTTGLPENGRDARYNEVWGFTVNGEEFGVIGSTMGTHIIHLPLNNAIYEAAFFPGGQDGEIVIHRDFAFYEGYLYTVCQQAPGILQVIDVRGLPDHAELILEDDTEFSVAHNIYCDETSGLLYVCGPSGDNNLSLMDASVDPANPQFIGHYPDIPYVHDCYVRNDTAYLNCANDGLFVFDFADPHSPVALGTLTEYEDQGYNHSGWLSEDGNTYVFADETVGMKMKVCDVSDLSDIQVLSVFNSGNPNDAIPHNLIWKNDTVYVSHYFDGLQIFDMTDPSNPERIAWYDTYLGDDVCCAGAWGIHSLLPSGRILISDRQSGFYVFGLNMNQDLSGTPEILMSPNPGDGMIYLNLIEFDFLEASFEVYDIEGRLVATRGFVNKGDLSHWGAIDIREQADGIYIVRGKINTVEYSAKYVKNTQ